MFKTPFRFGKKIEKDPKKAVKMFQKFQGKRDPEMIKKGIELFGSEREFREFLHEFFLILAKKRIRKSYSPDIVISHLISSSEEIDKIINTLFERINEIYCLYRPERYGKMDINEIIKVIKKDNTQRTGDMGFSLDKNTLNLLKDYADQLEGLIGLRRNVVNEINNLMKKFAPNLSKLMGEMLGAKIISIAGSLKNLAKMPSSTIQVLGAEKALFRHLRKGTKPPKHGVIIQHPLVAQAKKGERGRIARAVASKAAIAAKVDYYNGDFVGDKLLKELEERE